MASNARRLIEVTGAILQQLSAAEDSVLKQLAEIARQLREINRLDESTTELMRAHEAAAIELEELERSILTYRAHLEIDPEALQWMEERLNLLQSLQRKHHRDENGLLELMEELKERLERLDRREEMLAKIDAQLVSETQDADPAWRRVDQFQNAHGEKSFEINPGASERSRIRQAAFEIRIDRSYSNRGPPGLRRSSSCLRANPGEPLKPLRAVASSGEISRVMLAVKTALAQQDLVGLAGLRRDRCECRGRDCSFDRNENAFTGREPASGRDHPYATGCGRREPSLQREQGSDGGSHPDFAHGGCRREPDRGAGSDVRGQERNRRWNMPGSC